MKLNGVVVGLVRVSMKNDFVDKAPEDLCKRRPRPIVFFAFAVSRRVEADGCRELVRDYETRSL